MRGVALLPLLCVLWLPAGCSTPRTDSSKPIVFDPSKPREDTDPQRACREAAVAVQVLGSGGPIADDARASSAYLVWIDGRARVLIDAGGGLFVRFGATGAKLRDLDVVALSHLHADHSVGLPALLKSGYFGKRERSLPLVGPSGNADFPAVDAFLRALLDQESGAYAYLGGYLEGHSPFTIEANVIDTETSDGNAVAFENERLRLYAVSVHHGNVPSLGFVIQMGETLIAFAGDQSATGNSAFVARSRGAKVMIAHHAIPEDADPLRDLHATPSEIGRMAAEADVDRLVLSHNMRRALDDLERGKPAIRQSYRGSVEVAEDLDCFVVR